MNEIYFVVAGNISEYRNFTINKCDELWAKGEHRPSFSNFRYATVDNIRGHRNPHGFFVGTWYERQDLMDVVYVLLMAQDTDNPTLVKIYDEVSRRGSQKAQNAQAQARNNAIMGGMVQKTIMDEVLKSNLNEIADVMLEDKIKYIPQSVLKKILNETDYENR